MKDTPFTYLPSTRRAPPLHRPAGRPTLTAKEICRRIAAVTGDALGIEPASPISIAVDTDDGVARLEYVTPETATLALIQPLAGRLTHRLAAALSAQTSVTAVRVSVLSGPLSRVIGERSEERVTPSFTVWSTPLTCCLPRCVA